MSWLSALSGETYSTLVPCPGAFTSRSMAHRNAVSVLPEPVGAKISVWRPSAIGGQPIACARVGSRNDRSNQSLTGAEKVFRTVCARVTHEPQMLAARRAGRLPGCSSTSSVPAQPGQFPGWGATVRSAPRLTRATNGCARRCWWTGGCWWMPAPMPTGSCAALGVVPEAVVVTHSHHDHTLGLHELAKLRLPLYLTKATEREIRKLFPRLDYRITHIAPGIPVDLGEGLELRAFDVEHGSTPTLGLRLQRDGRSVAYMPDLGAPPASKLARNADLAVVDGSSRSRPVGGHLPMEQMIAVAAKLRPGRTLFTHIGHRTGTQVELEEWLPEGFGVAYDGLQVDV